MPRAPWVLWAGLNLWGVRSRSAAGAITDNTHGNAVTVLVQERLWRRRCHVMQPRSSLFQQRSVAGRVDLLVKLIEQSDVYCSGECSDLGRSSLETHTLANKRMATQLTMKKRFLRLCTCLVCFMICRRDQCIKFAGMDWGSR